MQLILYHRGKLILLAAAVAVLVAALIIPIVVPGSHPSGWALLLTSGWFGHYLLGPALVIGGLLFVWRVAMVAAGSLEALSIDREGVQVTTLWASRQIPWSDLILPRIAVRQTRYGKHYTLVFDRYSAASVRLSLSLTALSRDEYQDIVEMVAQGKYELGRHPARSAGGETSSTSIPSSGERPRAPLHGSSIPAPRGFGRKGA